MKIEQMMKLFEVTDFKEMKQTLVEMAFRDALNESELWKATNISEDVIAVYTLLDSLDRIVTSKRMNDLEVKN